jgi:hypothetical protein
VGETVEQHSAAWKELGELLVALAADPSNTAPVAAAVNRRERLGQASPLTMSIRREYSRPNLVLDLNSKWLETQLKQTIDEPYDVNGVFAGTRSVGSGRLVGTLHSQVMPSTAVGRWQLLFNGTSTARASGSQDRVNVVSRATTRIAATKPFRIDARGLQTERASAGAVTSIVYESIDSPGLARRRSQAVSETNARRPQAERESAEYARRSILDRINQEAAKVAEDFNRSYHAELRDPRINALRPSPEIRVRAADGAMRWQCLLEGPNTFGAPSAPEIYDCDTEVVMSVAASAIEEQATMNLGGRELTGEQMLERMGRKPITEDAEGGDAFNVTFAEDPCDVRFEDGAVRVRLYITKFDSADVRYPAMTVDVVYQPEIRDSGVVFVRQGRVRVTPLAAAGEIAPKISGRQQTLRWGVERKLAKGLTEELPCSDVKLPLAGGEETTLRVERARLEGPWLQLGLSPLQAAPRL